MVKAKQYLKQKVKKKGSGKGKNCEHINDDSETYCEDKNISYADSSSNDDLVENLDLNDPWCCFVHKSKEIINMRLCWLSQDMSMRYALDTQGILMISFVTNVMKISCIYHILMTLNYYNKIIGIREKVRIENDISWEWSLSFVN